MARLVAIVSLAVLAPLAARAQAPVARVQATKQFELRPPKSFRPSDTVDRLVDTLASTNANGRYTYHPQLQPRMTEHGTVMTIDTALLRSKNAGEHAGIQHVLGFAKSYGFTIHTAPADAAAVKADLEAYGAAGLVQTP